MNHDDPDSELDQLLAPLRNGPVALSGAADSAARRLRLLPKVRQAVRDVPARRQRARRRTAMLWTGTAVAAAALLGVAIAHNTAADSAADARGGDASSPAKRDAAELRVDPLGHESAAWVDAGGARHPIHASAVLEGSGELVAAAGSWSRLSTPQGVQVELAPRTRLRVRGAARSLVGAQLNLVEGEVHCAVPKLGGRAHFAIETADARVIVHGTRFSVHVGTPDHPGTCVKVSEGLVEVRHDGTSTMLPRGTQWGCAPEGEQVATVNAAPVRARLATPAAPSTTVKPRVAASARETAIASARTQRAATRRSVRASRSTSRVSGDAVAIADTPTVVESKPTPASARPASEAPVQPARASGTLGEENHLLGAALTAERSGDDDRARALFQQLIAQHPSSPLVPEARTGLSRVR